MYRINRAYKYLQYFGEEINARPIGSVANRRASTYIFETLTEMTQIDRVRINTNIRVYITGWLVDPGLRVPHNLGAEIVLAGQYEILEYVAQWHEWQQQ